MYTAKFGEVFVGDYFYHVSSNDKEYGFYITELYSKNGRAIASGTWSDGNTFVKSNINGWSHYIKVSMKETRVKKLLTRLDEINLR